MVIHCVASSKAGNERIVLVLGNILRIQGVRVYI
ncbi:hypothetical protein EMIT0P44_500035 [Pseudomonas sp. IT-P44]